MKAKGLLRIVKMLFPFIILVACNTIDSGNSLTLTPTPSTTPRPIYTPSPTFALSATQTSKQIFTPTDTITHLIQPSNSPSLGELIYDAKSQETAPEQRAPYGDTYAINRFERPFLQDMTYIPDLDIFSFNVSQDESWYYVSIEMIGTDPNNPLGIHYGVELDLDRDGFGDYIIWGNPLYNPQWTTDGIQVFFDKNHDTGGLAANRSDAPLTGDGYETLIFDSGKGNNPDLAWVRVNAGQHATVQFAFGKSLVGKSFMVGVVADAGLKDVSKYDYNDRFSDEEAGSPIRNKTYYPLGALYAFDNVCRTAIGFKPSGYELQLCPLNSPPPAPTRKPTRKPSSDDNQPIPQNTISPPIPPYP